MPQRPRPRERLSSLVCVGVAAVAVCTASSASAAPPSGLEVIPLPRAQVGLSYFKLPAQPGTTVQAGAIELRNPTAKSLRAALAPVDGETLDTLGSSYAPPGSRRHGSTLWLQLGAHAVTLSPGGRLLIPVRVHVPAGARPGDYLSGVSVEALDQRSQNVQRKGVSIASVSRYAIGVEVSLPGVRHSVIELNGARIRREPAGLTFALLARNSGNVTLQGVHGEVRITRGGHTVLSQRIAPGTFLAETSIAYPLNDYRESPAEGTHFRITAWLRYPGGTARLNRTLTFGHHEAVAQQQYGGPPPASTGGTAWWKIAAVVAAILYGLMTTALLLRRRTRGAEEPLQP